MFHEIVNWSSLGWGLQGWWRFTDVTFASNSPRQAETLTDKSGNSRHLNAVNKYSRPVWISDTGKGYGGLWFVGQLLNTSMFAQDGSSMYTNWNPPAGTNQRLYVLVYSHHKQINHWSVILRAGLYGLYTGGSGAEDKVWLYDNVWPPPASHRTDIGPSTGFDILLWGRTSSNQFLYMRDAWRINTPVSTSTTAGPLYVGRDETVDNRPCDFIFYELAVFNTWPGITEIEKIIPLLRRQYRF